jgi:pimeloyl-ACP methyl ester carboxylesterase
MNEEDRAVSSAEDGITRRDLMHRAVAAAAVGMFLPGAEAQSGAQTAPLDIAEYSWSWVGVERSKLARGTVPNGEHMYVEYQIPRQVRHPYPIVLVHGGNGQGLDWMGTPDGRRGWASYLLEAGYKVYIVDRPGQGRPIYHPALFGAFDKAPTYEEVERNITALAKNPAATREARLHSQWPGSGEIGDPALDQLLASLGQIVPDSGYPLVSAGPARIHEVWRSRGAILLDQIGPAILMTHGDSSPFAWLVADERPRLVKGIIAIEPLGPSFGPLRWGLTASPITYEPPATKVEEIRTAAASAEPGVTSYRLQAAPARRLANLAGIPIAVVTGEASPGNLRDPGTVAFLRQAGCTVEHLRLADQGVRGNGPYMMLEKNNREALQPILGWMDQHVSGAGAAPSSPSAASQTGATAVKLADQGYFWTGVERKKVPYGTIATGQMYVQYFVPAEVRYPHPIVLIHGGGGQATHMMGLGGRPGFLHYFIQEGYRVYLVDRPAFGRSPYHPDAFDPSLLGLFATYDRFYEGLNIFRVPHWPGTGEVGDPLVDQFVPNELGRVDEVIASELFVKAGEALLDKIGPSILLTHSNGGTKTWALSDRRHELVKGIVAVEIDGDPFVGELRWGVTSIPVSYDPPVSDPAQLSLVDVPSSPDAPGVPPHKLQRSPARQLKNLKGIPIAWVSGELRSLPSVNRNNGPAQVAFLKQAGCTAEHLQLKDFGVTGNGNLMLFETNNKDVFGVIRDWLAKSVAAPSSGKV